MTSVGSRPSLQTFRRYVNGIRKKDNSSARIAKHEFRLQRLSVRSCVMSLARILEAINVFRVPRVVPFRYLVMCLLPTNN